MTNTAEDPRFIQLANKVRFVLSCVASEARGETPLDELDDAYLDLASDAQAVLFILDARMKFGPLLDDQIEAHAAASREHDAAIAALKIANPYRARAN